MAALGGGMRLKGRNGEIGCQASPTPPVSSSQRDIAAPSSHRGAPGPPSAQIQRSQHWWEWAVSRAQPAGWGLPSTLFLQPPSPEAGFFSFALSSFWADFPELLGMGSARLPVSTLTSTPTSFPEFQG